MRPRWDPYFLASGGESSQFWRDYLAEGDSDVLIICGSGFDPRTPLGAQEILHAGGGGKRDCLLLDYDEGDNSPSTEYEELASANADLLAKEVANRGTVDKRTVRMWSGSGPGKRRISS